MNRNLNEDLDEKNIRKLFGEMRAVDEQTAPPFAAVSQIPANTGNAVRLGRLVPIAAAIVILIFAFVAALIHFRKTPPQQVVITDGSHKQQVAEAQPTAPEVDKPSKLPAPRRVAQRPRNKAPRRTELLISRWRSPTEFLLRTPGNEFLRTVPRFDDSRLKINSAMPN